MRHRVATCGDGRGWRPLTGGVLLLCRPTCQARGRLLRTPYLTRSGVPPDTYYRVEGVFGSSLMSLPPTYNARLADARMQRTATCAFKHHTQDLPLNAGQLFRAFNTCTGTQGCLDGLCIQAAPFPTYTRSSLEHATACATWARRGSCTTEVKFTHTKGW